MMAETHTINLDDVRTAIQDLNPEKRANATLKLSRTIKNPKLSRADREFANRALEVISKDMSELVRRALAVTLKNSIFLPKSVLAQLITDIDSIAVPLITHSPLLNDEDLALIIQSGISGKIQAVAGRQDLSNRVMMSLIHSKDTDAIRRLAANDTLPISQDAAQAMVELYNEDDYIRAALIQRASMPMPVVEKLIAASADDIANNLYKRSDLTRPQSKQIGAETYERATTQLTNDNFSESTLKDLVNAIQANGRLTPELVLRAMGLGKIGLVHYAMAKLSGLSVRKTVLMLHDTGPFALHSLCIRAGMNEGQTTFMMEATRIYTDLEISGNSFSAIEFQQRMIERILTLPIKLEAQDESYFLAILDGLEKD